MVFQGPTDRWPFSNSPVHDQGSAKGNSALSTKYERAAIPLILLGCVPRFGNNLEMQCIYEIPFVFLGFSSFTITQCLICFEDLINNGLFGPSSSQDSQQSGCR